MKSEFSHVLALLDSERNWVDPRHGFIYISSLSSWIGGSLKARSTTLTFVEPSVSMHSAWKLKILRHHFDFNAQKVVEMLQSSVSPTLNYKVLYLFKNLNS